MRHWKVMAAGGVLLLLLGAAALVWTGTEQGGPATPPVSTVPAPAPAPWGVPGKGEEKAPPPAPGPGPEGAPEKGTAPKPEPTARRFILRGRLRGIPQGTKVAARLEVTSLGLEASPETVVGASALDGTVELDVSGVFAGGGQIPEIEVAMDHPACLPATEKVPVPAGAAAEGPVVLSLDATLAPAAVLQGRVVDGWGAPIPGAEVAAFPLTSEGPEAPAVDQARVEIKGEWRLRLRSGVRYLVIAAASGRRPAAREATGGDAAVAEMVLDEGASISGRVVDARGQPLAGAVVGAQSIMGDLRGLRVGGREVAWSKDGLQAGEATGTAVSDGRYRIAGLDETEWQVQVKSVQGLDALPDAFSDSRRQVRAPAEDVDFATATVRLLLHVRVDGLPAPGAGIFLSGEGRVLFGKYAKADSRGTLDFIARAGATYQADMFGKEGSRAIQVPTEAGTEHEENLDFTTPRPKGALIVILENPGGGGVGKAGLAFFPPEEEDVPSAEREVTGLTRNLEGTDGRFRVADVEPGKYLVVGRAGGTWEGGQSLHLEEAAVVEIPASGEQEVRFRLRPAGRLRIAAKDPEGEYLGAVCTVEDPEGRKVPATFVSRGAYSLQFSDDELMTAGPCNVEPALSPGRYTVRLSLAGFLDRVETVSVEAGKTAEVLATMERR